jgi:2,4-dienoyl-CoA reductase-like NADH-dependent reductase (Old Yellow Enzyme family)
MHLAPRGDVMGMGDVNPRATFTYLATELGKRNLAFLLAREYHADDRLGPDLKRAFGGVYIANEKYTQAQAEQVILAGEADAVAFGKLFIANPTCRAGSPSAGRTQPTQCRDFLFARSRRVCRLSRVIDSAG